jgi:plastocyanin
MRNATHRFRGMVLAGVAVTAAFGIDPRPTATIRWTATAAAAEPTPPTAADFARLAGELARVQQELRDQRQLILQVMEMHSALLRYMQSSPSGGPAPAFPPAATGMAQPPAGGAAASGGGAPGTALTASSREGTVSGSVKGAQGEVYVYVDGLRGGPAHPPSIEIKQVDRRFAPAVSVVPVNTRVSFPNADKVFHNVFSRTPGSAFDLGTVKAGEKPGPTVLAKPGHVEVFCNIHSKMRADILVVSSSHWTRVRPDGTFQIKNVPVGAQRVVLWGPGVKPALQRVDVTAAGGAANFNAEAATVNRHLNKHGAEYGSYDE